jgi:CHAT domain/Cytosol aminopeptidase family, N-terminal domain
MSSPGPAPVPVSLRMAVGDIAAAQASLIAVSHFNGLAPAGAEAAIDSALGGAISRRAASGALDGQFGASRFLPAANAPLAADAVLVLCLGEPGKLDPRRLSELGAAMVDAMTSIGVPDAATVIHGAGLVGLPASQALRQLLGGFLQAAARLDDSSKIARLTVVEHEKMRIQRLRRTLRATSAPEGLSVRIDAATERLGQAAGSEVDVEVAREHLRIAVTRSAQELKVTVISEGAYDAADRGDYPEARVVDLLDLVQAEVLANKHEPECVTAMQSLGDRLYEEFFKWPEFDLAKRLRKSRGHYLVLRLDESTVDLPWELMRFGNQFLARSHLLARQREINAPGHAAAYVAPHERLRALVIGNPTSKLPGADLSGAAEEAEHVSGLLHGYGAKVDKLVGEASQAQVLDLLDRHNPDVLHYAGHARFDTVNQAAGGLLLSDGLLTADTLAAQPHLPRLVFANACNSAETGVGSDQALDAKERRDHQGASDAASATRDLAGGILRAGARAFIGSQWPVDDKAGKTFAEAFYGQLVGKSGVEGTGATIGLAVKRAREATISAHGLEEPTWAGYSLYGSPWATAL